MQELPEGPIAVSGRVLTAFDEDRYRLAVAPGKKVRLEVFAERIGSPLDAALVVRNEKGDVLARVEDSPGTLDPVLEYAVPDKVTAIIVGVVDAQGRAGPRAIYRLVVDPQTAARSGEDWKLTTTTVPRWPCPRLGGPSCRCFSNAAATWARSTWPQPCRPGVRAEGTLIPAGADGTLLTLERERRAARRRHHPLDRPRGWMARIIRSRSRGILWNAAALAGDGDRLGSSNIKGERFCRRLARLSRRSPVWCLGGKLVLPFKTARTKDKTTVKLTLLTSQVPPLL